MDTINKTLVDDYFQRKADANELRQKAQDNRAEVGDLEQQVNTVKAEINDLQVKLQTAEKEMHWGKLTHDEFLQFKRDRVEKTEQLKDLTEALTEKKEAASILDSKLNMARRPIGSIKKQLASDMVDQFASKVVELASDPLKNLVNALVVSKGMDSGYTINDKNRYRQALYTEICKAIFETVSDDRGGTSILLPDLHQASQQVEELISNIAHTEPALLSQA